MKLQISGNQVILTFDEFMNLHTKLRLALQADTPEECRKHLLSISKDLHVDLHDIPLGDFQSTLADK